MVAFIGKGFLQATIAVSLLSVEPFWPLRFFRGK